MLFLKILTGVFLALLLILLFLLVIKIKIKVIAKNEELKVQVKLLFFEFTVFPNEFKRKPKKKDKPDIKTVEEAPQNEVKPATDSMKIGEIVDFTLDMLNEVENSVTIEVLLVSFIIATSNAARTGILLGQISAAVGCIIPYLYNHFTIKQRNISIDADFTTDKIRWDIYLVFSTRGIKLLIILKHNYKRIMEFIKKQRKVEGTHA